MFAKIEITGKIEVITGVHIGGSSSFAAIGAVDSPIIKDEITGFPIIPGSSLKGKMRTLLAKKYNKKIAKDPNEDDKCLTDLFGFAKEKNNKPSRVIFSDMLMSNWDELKNKGLYSKTEIKFENSINRTTAVATPRQIERTIRGSEFDLNIIYEVDYLKDDAEAEETLKKDMAILADGFKLLKYDYLGGSGSRGYGKVKFKELKADVVIGDVTDETIEECNNILETV